jgi:hypothetical protein
MPEDRDRLIEVGREMIAVVRDEVAQMRFTGPVGEAVAAAGMLRAADFLDEALALAERGRSIGANVLARSAFECWLAGAYALFGGDDAVLGFEAERHRHETRIAKTLDNPGVEAFLEVEFEALNKVLDMYLDGKPNPVNLADISKRLGGMITQATGEDADIELVYETLYRTHSTYDAHPVKALGSMVKFDEADVGRVEPVGPWLDPVEAALVMCMYVATLGRWLVERRGEKTTVWHDFQDRLVEALQS